jgi:chemotaxis protein CheZ
MDVATEGGGMAELRAAIRTEVGGLFAEMHRFVDRRIAELSAEVHGVTQLMDYSEANVTGQLSRVHEQIVGLLAAPAAATRNSGLELESVVLATEQAANQIMEAAEAIGDWLASGNRDAESVRGVAERINAIFEACTFQDLTGQRIRRAIEHLQKVETMLGGMIPEAPEGGVPAPEPPVAPLHATTHSLEAVATPDLDQDEIDRLLNG